MTVGTSPRSLVDQIVDPHKANASHRMPHVGMNREEAEARRKAAEEEAQQLRILADARAYEIREINKATASNPAYVQLQALEALKSMAKDPAAKIYFMDGNSPSPLPLLHMGDKN